MSNATDRSEGLGLGLHGFFSEYFKAGDEGYQQKNLTGRAPLKRRDKSRFFFDMNPHFYIIISFHIQFASSKAHLTNGGGAQTANGGAPPRPEPEVAPGGGEQSEDGRAAADADAFSVESL